MSNEKTSTDLSTVISVKQKQYQDELARRNRCLPDTGFLRVRQILGDPDADPPVAAILPISEAAWWKGIKEGRFPKQIKLSPRLSLWRVEDIRFLIELIAKGELDGHKWG